MFDAIQKIIAAADKNHVAYVQIKDTPARNRGVYVACNGVYTFLGPVKPEHEGYALENLQKLIDAAYSIQTLLNEEERK